MAATLPRRAVPGGEMWAAVGVCHRCNARATAPRSRIGARSTDRLIERLETEFADRPRLLDVIYFNPEAGELLEAHTGFKLLWSGTVEMSEEDAAADHVASPEDLCSVYRWVGE